MNTSGQSIVRRALGPLIDPFEEVVSAPGAEGLDRAYRRRLLFLLALAIAIDYADRATIGALAPDLKRVFSLSNTQIGLLASAFSFVGAGATVPAGVLADRFRRTLVLAGSIALWTLAMGATGAAVGFAMLLGTRVFLGFVTASARPTVASLTGDAFATRVRARALGVIDSGELIGDGIGFLLAGAIAAVLSWRGVFWTLGGLGAILAWFVYRLREPPRCGSTAVAERAGGDEAQRLAERADDVEPTAPLILQGDQARMPLWRAVHYTLRVRTNVIVIVATSVASFFYAGLRTFAIVYIVKDYGIGRSVADVSLLAVGAGALVGLLAGGRIGDSLIHHGHLNGRLVVSSFSYIFAVAFFVPGFLLHTYGLSLPIFMLAAAALTAPSAPLDAVRLDIIHPQLWGRAEGVRNVVKIAAEAGGPLLFGWLSDTLAGGGAVGLRRAFLISLAFVLAAGLILQVARRFYPSEVAAAAESTTGREDSPAADEGTSREMSADDERDDETEPERDEAQPPEPDPGEPWAKASGGNRNASDDKS